MGIFDRMDRVIRSNINSLLDSSEDPAKMIDQTIIDMQSELKKAKRELIETLGSAKRLVKEAREQEEEAGDWEKKAVLALEQGDETLAREALKRKRSVSRKVDETINLAQESEGRAAQMKDMIEQVERKIEELQARKSSFAGDVRRARSTSGSDAGLFRSATFSELDRMTNRLDQLEAEVEAHDLIADDVRQKAELDAKFRKLEKASGDVEVEDELASLKEKLRK